MPSVNNSVKNISIPSLAGGLLWADDVNDVFYAFGGYFPSSTPTPFATWAFRDSSQSWNTISARGDAMSYVAHGAGDVSPDAGVGYYLGGYHDDQTNTGWRNPRIYTSNLIEFDMINWRYSNNSGPDNIGRGEGLMIFIPASTSGLLIYFGGVIQDPSTGELSGVRSI